MLKLTDLQLDMLTELFNLGMGNAASALSEMVTEEVKLSIPKILFMNKDELTKVLKIDSSDHISGVSQNFQGMILGQALLTFPTDKSLELIRLLLQDSVPLENLTEFEEEALTEVGNIIINAGLSSLADIFEDEITSDLPVFNTGSCEDVIGNTGPTSQKQQTVLHLQIDFSIEKENIKGYVIYLLDLESISVLANHIDNYIQKISC